jgi:hypothetical protein
VRNILCLVLLALAACTVQSLGQKPSSTARSAPLVLTGAIPLENVHGRIDHFGFDGGQTTCHAISEADHRYGRTGKTSAPNNINWAAASPPNWLPESPKGNGRNPQCVRYFDRQSRAGRLSELSMCLDRVRE